MSIHSIQDEAAIEFEAAKSAFSQQQTLVKTYQNNLATQQTKLNSLVTEQEALPTKINAAKTNVSNKTKTLASAQLKLQTLLNAQIVRESFGGRTTTTQQQEIDTATRNVANATTALNSAKKALTTLQTRQKAIPAEITSCNTAITKINSTLSQAENKLNGLTQIYDTAKTKLANLNKQKTALNKALGNLPLTDTPLLLMPARLETRFVKNTKWQTELLIRVYPDDIHIDTFEPELTSNEISSGQQFWIHFWCAGNDQQAQLNAWTQLAQLFGINRAAWIVQACEPNNNEHQPTSPVDDPTNLPIQPVFPSVTEKAESWTRAAKVRCMPTRWLACGYRANKRVLFAFSEAVSQDLDAGPSPSLMATTEASDDALAPLENMRWLMDFNAAEKVGMAIRIGLENDEAMLGFDYLFVFGINSSIDNAAAGQKLEQLLQAQSYTDGLAFVPHGASTNNSAAESSIFVSRNTDYQQSFQYLFSNNTDPLTNANTLQHALGLNSNILASIDHANTKHCAATQAMNTVLWPATWGYFLENLLGNDLDATQIENTREHFIKHVAGDGNFPVLRVGNQPYGILPISPRPQPGASSTAQYTDKLQSIIELVRDEVQSLIENSTSINATADAESNLQFLQDALVLNAHTAQYQARLVFDDALFTSQQLSYPAGTIPNDIKLKRDQIKQKLQNKNMLNNFRIFQTMLFNQTFNLDAPLVTPDDSIQDIAYLNWLADGQTSFDDLLEGLDQQNPETNTLLYKLLRHALLNELTRTAQQILFKAGQVKTTRRSEPTVIDDSQGLHSDLSALESALSTHPKQSVRQIIHQLDAATYPEMHAIDELRAALQVLVDLSIKDLEKLLTQSLDCAIYRLDAWITSLAQRRILRLRENKAQGLTLGGYAWVENLRPKTGFGGSAKSVENSSRGGFIHAPSLNQAATAAVLRASYLSTEKQNQHHPFAINLSSQRVRLAMKILDGVRQGQSLSALLGYRFERDLQDAGLARYIETFRRLAPLGALYEVRHRIEQYTQENIDNLNLQQQKQTQATDIVNQAQNNVLLKQSAVTSYNKQISTKTKERDNLSAMITALQDTITSLTKLPGQKEKLAELQAEVAALNVKLSSAKASLTNLNKKLQTAKSQLTIATNALATAKANAVQLQAEANQHAQLAEQAKNNLLEAQAQEQELLKQRREELQLNLQTDFSSMESIAAERVVDGLSLQRRYKQAVSNTPQIWQAETIPFGSLGLPKVITVAAKKIIQLLQRLDDCVDAVSDALTANSIYNLMQGNVAQTNANLDSLSNGQTAPPELDFIQSPRTGNAITHRVMLLFDNSQSSAQQWPVNQNQVRAQCEPALNNWLAGLLGSPGNIFFQITFSDPQSHQVLFQDENSLSVLNISPLDLFTSIRAEYKLAQNQLRNRIIHWYLDNPPSDINIAASNTIEINFDRRNDWPVAKLSLNDMLAVLRACCDSMTHSRTLSTSDFSPYIQATSDTEYDLIDLQNRTESLSMAFENAYQQLQNAISSANTADIIDALARMNHYANQYPYPDLQTDIQQQAIAVEQIARTVYQKLQTQKHDNTSDGLLRRIELLLGREFVFVRRFNKQQQSNFSTLFANSDRLKNHSASTTTAWLQRMAKVKKNIDGLSALQTCMSLLHPDTAFEFHLAQLPHSDSAQWIGLEFSEDSEFENDALSIVAQFARVNLDSAATIEAGLIIDEWTEIVPAKSETTGIAFNYDAPGSRPPQSILLAAMDDAQSHWDLSTVENILHELRDLSRLRLLTPKQLDSKFAHILPASCFALNLNNETISTDFKPRANPVV